MEEKRSYPRFSTDITCIFKYYEGNPEEIDLNKDPFETGSGTILDISQGGVFIISDELVAVSMPVIIECQIGKKGHSIEGKVVRTGYIAENPSEVAQRFAERNVKGSTYIAVDFIKPLEWLDSTQL